MSVRAREDENNNNFCEIFVKSSKINPGGTRGPIGLIVISFFSSCLWHQDSIKKIVKKVILKNDLISVQKTSKCDTQEKFALFICLKKFEKVI